MRTILALFIVFLALKSEATDLVSLGLCQSGDGELMPIEKLVCESTPAMLEAMNPTLEIPNCNKENTGPKIISGDKPVSAVFVSCTAETLTSCKNIASSVMENQPGVTVNVLVTSDGIATESISKVLLELVDISNTKSAPFNILPINTVPDKFNISYMRDPGMFVNQSGLGTSFVGLPYRQGLTPGAMILDEAMKWCGLESTNTYKDLAGFDTAYNALVFNPNYVQSEELQREVAGLTGVNDYTTQNATMGGNFMALPNGTLVTGYTKLNKTNTAVLDYFSRNHKVLEIELPDLYVGHIDEVINIVSSNSPCGYTIFQASPAEAVRYLESISEKNEPFMSFFDVSLVDPELPEKRPIQDELQALNLSKREFMESSKEIPSVIIEREKQLLKELEILSGRHLRTPLEIISDSKIMNHWKNLEQGSNSALKKVLKELSLEENSCIPEVVKLPVFWDYTMAKPLIPNPVNGLALNGSYFKSTSMGSSTQRNDQGRSRMSYLHLDAYINQKIHKLFPMGVHSVDTFEHNEGAGNFHCATTNIYLPCK